MNKNRYRLIFNKVRNQLMAVGESAQMDSRDDANRPAASRQRNFRIKRQKTAHYYQPKMLY